MQGQPNPNGPGPGSNNLSDMLAAYVANRLIGSAVDEEEQGMGGVDKLLDDAELEDIVQPPETYGYPSATGNPFYNLSQFPSMSILHQNWVAIREEALAARAETPVLKAARPGDAWCDAEQFEKFFQIVDKEEGWHRAPHAEGDEPNDEWLNFGLIFNGRPLLANSKRCPKTIELLSQLPIRIAGFSLLLPKTRLGEHRDATGVPYHSLAYHLGLDVPEGGPGCCRLTVNTIGVDEANGRPIVFDSCYTHYACNKTEKERMILYVDFSIVVHPNGLIHERTTNFAETTKGYKYEELDEDDFSRESKLERLEDGERDQELNTLTTPKHEIVPSPLG